MKNDIDKKFLCQFPHWITLNNSIHFFVSLLKRKIKDLFLIKPLQDLWTKALHKGKVSLFITISIPEMIKAKENKCDIH